MQTLEAWSCASAEYYFKTWKTLCFMVNLQQNSLVFVWVQSSGFLVLRTETKHAKTRGFALCECGVVQF